MKAVHALGRDPNDPHWIRGLLSTATLPTLAALGCHLLRYYRNNIGGFMSGYMYTDGSMAARWWWAESQRAGWGLATLNGRSLAVGLYGTLPGPGQSVPRAELFAVDPEGNNASDRSSL